jgi:hypothetical protein
MLKHIAFGAELRKPPYAPPPPPPPEISVPPSRTASFRTSASASSATSGGGGGGGEGSGGESLTLKEVERQLIREGAADALGAARGDHLGALFQVVMPDGRLRADWEYAIWEQVQILKRTLSQTYAIY